MSQLSSSSKRAHFFSLLFADFISLCSLVSSHPLYFAYIYFFSSYLLHILSILFPLLLSTSLLFIALLTISPGLDDSSLGDSESKYGFLVNTCQTLLSILRTKLEDNVEFRIFEPLESMALELESCMMVEEFAPRNYDENSPLKYEGFLWELEKKGAEMHGAALIYKVGENPKSTVEVAWMNREESFPKISENYEVLGSSLRGFEISTGIEMRTYKVVEDPIKVGFGTQRVHILKASENLEVLDSNLKGFGSDTMSETLPYKVAENPIKDELGNREEKTFKAAKTLASNVEGLGSMRKEKEWKRTLACKLFEERRTIDESEGMDSLWEVEEIDSTKAKVKSGEKKKKKKGEEEEEEDDEMNANFCCLQALRLSTGKMNLGMGRTNLARISKALKGMSLLKRREKF